jgi:DNA-binding NarL/FixJ family response regulator
MPLVIIAAMKMALKTATQHHRMNCDCQESGTSCINVLERRRVLFGDRILEIALNPDVVLLDVALPNFNGMTEPKLLRSVCPRRQSISLLNMIRSKWREPRRSGRPRGYISKVHLPTDPVPAIEASVDFPRLK